MSSFTHNTDISLKMRLENEQYNSAFVREHNLIGAETVTIENLDVPDIAKLGSAPYMLVWLKNIDRLFSMLPDRGAMGDMVFIDIGCGSGISTIYAAMQNNFQYYMGIDFSEDLIAKANINLELIQQRSRVDDIEFQKKDAKQFDVPNKPCMLFMFNPFDWSVMEKFISRNIERLRKNSSIIIYANDICIDELHEYGDILCRDEFFNLSVIQL